MRTHHLKTRALGLFVVLIAASFDPLAAVEPIAAVCQDYGGFPEVGGTRVCVTDNGYICRFRSVPNGVTGGCEQA